MHLPVSLQQMRDQVKLLLQLIIFLIGTVAIDVQAAEKPYILLMSGWQTINIGDMGHTVGTLRIFERDLPDVPVVWWAASINNDVRKLHERRFPRVRIVEGRVDDQGVPDTEELRDAAKSAAIIIANSKPGLSTSVMRLAKHMNKPWGCYGHSLEADTFTKRPELIPQFNTASFIFCRDTQTLATIRKTGINAKNIAFGPDGCFGIDVRNDVKANEWLQRNGLRPKSFITIMLRTNTPKHPTNDDPLNPQSPSPEQKQADESRAAKFREVMCAWVRETGLKIVIAPEVDKEIAHNKRLLLDPLPSEVKSSVVLRDSFWLPDEAASVFANARVVVCHEPHSCIIALAMGTPILHPSSLQHGPKREMFGDIGLQEWLFDLDAEPASRVTGALLKIHRDFPAAEKKTRQAMQFVTDKQQETTRVILQLLGH